MNLLQQAFEAFDRYNAQDPNQEVMEGKSYPKEVLYGQRMTERLNQYAPDAPQHVQLAARCQHIGRWEIARKSFPMDRKGYLQWRTAEKLHQSSIAESILHELRFDLPTIEKVKNLLMKKELSTNADTQLLEDVICLVFIEHYLEEFASQHEDEKVVDILFKTMKKMTPRGLTEAGKIDVSDKLKGLIGEAAGKL
jgi:hypothetical protein